MSGIRITQAKYDEIKTKNPTAVELDYSTKSGKKILYCQGFEFILDDSAAQV